MHSYTATTEGVQVTVRPVYLDGQSNVLERKFVFAYFITIANKGSVPIQLLRRHWVIRHGSGKTEEVEGEGVVGKQPVIQPGGDHDYNSYCVLETPEGSMEGTYLMRREDGTEFRVAIPKFNLRAMAN
ncbi:MAG: Co2+/Mg2+ efflux protein ApaG [Ignavibacterium sp.]|jgi:ApaG protein